MPPQHPSGYVQVGENRARARMLCGSQDSWIRHVAPGDPVHLAFMPSQVASYRTAEEASPLGLEAVLPEVAGSRKFSLTGWPSEVPGVMLTNISLPRMLGDACCAVESVRMRSVAGMPSIFVSTLM